MSSSQTVIPSYTPGHADGLGAVMRRSPGMVCCIRGRDGRRLIMVVNGLESKRARAEEAEKLMNWGFSHFENRTLL